MKKNNERIGRRVAVNKRVVEISDFTDGVIIQLENLGVFSLRDDKQVDEKTALNVAVAVYAISAGISIEEATEEINQHLRSGGDIDRLLQIVTKAANRYIAPLQR